MEHQIDIIQVYKLHAVIEKPDYTPETRKRLLTWPNSLDSETGYLKNKILTLNGNAQVQVDSNTNLIILQETIDYGSELLKTPDALESSKKLMLTQEAAHFIFKSPDNLYAFEVFKLWKEEDIYHIFLNYSNSNTFIGNPTRDYHKIAELKINAPIRFRINGQNDFSLTGRRQRTFYEYDFIIEYLGSADKIKYKRTLGKIRKKIPLNARLIDERKLFY